MALLCVFSCTKKKEDQDPSPAVNPYYQAFKGNYWIYDTYKIDTAAYPSGEMLQGRDSVVVSGDTLINGKHYAVFSGTNSPFYSQWRVLDIIRDSSGCIVNNYGDVIFSSANNSSDVLSTRFLLIPGQNEPDTFMIFKWFMQGPPKVIQVPAGSFTVLKGVKRNIEVRDEITTDYDNCYAPGVGLVLSQSSWQYLMRLGIYYERRLVRYHVSY